MGRDANTPDENYHHGYGQGDGPGQDYQHAHNEKHDWTPGDDATVAKRKEEYQKRLDVFKEKHELQTMDKLQRVGETYTFQKGDTLYPALKDFYGMNEHTAFLVMMKLLQDGVNVDLIHPGDSITLTASGESVKVTLHREEVTSSAGGGDTKETAEPDAGEAEEPKSPPDAAEPKDTPSKPDDDEKKKASTGKPDPVAPVKKDAPPDDASKDGEDHVEVSAGISTITSALDAIANDTTLDAEDKSTAAAKQLIAIEAYAAKNPEDIDINMLSDRAWGLVDASYKYGITGGELKERAAFIGKELKKDAGVRSIYDTDVTAFAGMDETLREEFLKTLNAIPDDLNVNQAFHVVDSSHDYPEIIDGKNMRVVLRVIFPEFITTSVNYKTFPFVQVSVDLNSKGEIQAVNGWETRYRGKPTAFTPFIGKTLGLFNLGAFREAVRRDAGELLSKLTMYAGGPIAGLPQVANIAQLHKKIKSTEKDSNYDDEALTILQSEDYDYQDTRFSDYRVALRRVIPEWIAERGSKIDPTVKARMLSMLADTYLVAGENINCDLNPAEALDNTDEALAILDAQPEIEKAWSPHYHHLLYNRAHAMRVSGESEPAEVLKAYRAGFDYYRKFFIESGDVPNLIVGEYTSFLLEQKQYKEARAFYDELKKINGEYAAGKFLNNKAVQLLNEGDFANAKLLFGDNINPDSPMAIAFKIKEWPTLSEAQRLDVLEKFLGIAGDVDRFKERFSKRFDALMKGKETPWDVAPGNMNLIRAHWLLVSAQSNKDPNRKLTKCDDALDELNYVDVTQRTGQMTKDAILGVMSHALAKQLIQNTTFWRGDVRGDRVEFVEGKDKQVNADSEYMYYDLKHGIAIEKYVNAEMKKGTMLPFNSNWEIKDTGASYEAGWFKNGRVFLKKESTWYPVLDTQGWNHPLYVDLFTYEITAVPTMKQMYDRASAICPPGWSVAMHDDYIHLLKNNNIMAGVVISETDNNYFALTVWDGSKNKWVVQTQISPFEWDQALERFFEKNK